MTGDRRNFYRFELKNEQVQIESPPTMVTARMKNISASGGQFIFPSNQIPDLEKRPVYIRMGDYPPMETRIVPTCVHKENGSTKISARFQDMGLEL